MATVTLTANTDVSALTLANDDTIDLAGFALTFDVQPTVTGIQVTTPGTDGRCVFPVACVIPTWDFFGGSNTFGSGLIATLPGSCEIGSIVGGGIANSRGVVTNNGTIGFATGGAGSGSVGVATNNGDVGEAVSSNTAVAFGVATNNGTVGTANASSVTNAYGVQTNNGTVGTANGGTVSNANGVQTNNGIIGVANGAGPTAFGVQANNGTIGTANGGPSSASHGVLTNSGAVGTANGGGNAAAFGVATNTGTVLRASDNIGAAINISRGDFKLVIGPEFQTTIDNPAGDITTIYSIGPLSELATIPEGVEVITLSEGTGTAGFTGIRAISRRLGT